MGRKLDKAKARYAEAAQKAEEWERREDGLTAQLEQAEESIGTDALESGDVEGAAAGLATLREQVHVARSTAHAGYAAREAAHREALLAEADELESQAAKLEKRAKKHEAKTKELLAALEAHEGGPYEPVQPPIGVGTDLKTWTPLSDQYRIEANEARLNAEELRRKVAESVASQDLVGAGV